MNTVIFDVETVPLPASELISAIPPFNPEDVKYGNAKDPEKRAAILANAETRHREDFIRDAALDPRTGRIKAAGFRNASNNENLIVVWESDTTTEATLIRLCKQGYALDVHPSYSGFLANVAMRIMASIPDRDHALLGYYIQDFDLPFLFQSCWMNDVAISPRHYRRGRYWNDNIIDLYQQWGFGERYAATGGLEGLGKLLGCRTQKQGDGKNFGTLYDQDPKAAIDYLIADLMLTEECARKMGEI
jgi:hypothetical protein